MSDLGELLGLVRRYDRSGPRYTSYPTAVEFHEGVDSARYREHLDAAATAQGPLGFYIHLPFCEERCLFCGCNVVITKKREVADAYIGYLETELRQTGERLQGRRPIAQYHWGGGTPTYYTPGEMRRIHAAVAASFPFEDDAEMAIEVDPRVTTEEHLDALRELGFNRISCGVQDFDADVQQAVRRIQPFESTAELVAASRARGFESVNLDLIYGLPRQKPESFERTLELVARLRPDRIAFYSYAHVPWMKGHQRKLDPDELPDAPTKLALYTMALETFRSQGYLAIGMDHFALPEDELGRAADEGTLGRNFMGYTVKHAADLVACGLSGIGEIGGAFFQNRRKLSGYQEAIAAEGLAVDRGYVLTDEDRLRRFVIASLMCGFRVAFAEVDRRFGVSFRDHFREELAGLEPMARDGLVRVEPDRIEVTERGRLFVRNICMEFDAYLAKHRPDRPRFSRTV